MKKIIGLKNIGSNNPVTRRDILRITGMSDALLQTKDGESYPVAHPDITNSPQVLPQRFCAGAPYSSDLYDIIEVVVDRTQLSSIPEGAMIIYAAAFNSSEYDGAVKINHLPLGWEVNTSLENYILHVKYIVSQTLHIDGTLTASTTTSTTPPINAEKITAYLNGQQVTSSDLNPLHITSGDVINLEYGKTEDVVSVTSITPNISGTYDWGLISNDGTVLITQPGQSDHMIVLAGSNARLDLYIITYLEPDTSTTAAPSNPEEPPFIGDNTTTEAPEPIDALAIKLNGEAVNSSQSNPVLINAGDRITLYASTATNPYALDITSYISGVYLWGYIQEDGQVNVYQSNVQDTINVTIRNYTGTIYIITGLKSAVTNSPLIEEDPGPTTTTSL